MSNSAGWSLVCVAGGVTPGTHEITEDGVTLGRGDVNVIVLQSGNVSRQHARVFLYEGTPWVQDMGSRNGVYVNSERIGEQAPLSHGDTVVLGEFTFRAERAGQGKVETSTPGPGLASLPRKPMMIAGAVAAVLLVLGLAVSLSGGDDAGDVVKTADVPKSEGDLFDFKAPGSEPVGGEAAGPAAKPREIDVASSALGATAQLSVADRNRLTKEYLERGLQNQTSGRLGKAKSYYGQALQLDPGCALCASRLERVSREIDLKTKEHNDRALRYYKGLRYQEAINHWQLILHIQEEGSEAYQKATSYIEEAQAKLDASLQFN